MRRRSAALIAATIGATALIGVAASGAAAPPSPHAINGSHVQLVAAGLKTPTTFAFGDGAVFEGDGGNNANRGGPPNGGVYLLKGGTGTAIAGSPQFVAGLAWHDGALYVSGGFVTGPTSAKWQILRWSGWNGT